MKKQFILAGIFTLIFASDGTAETWFKADCQGQEIVTDDITQIPKECRSNISFISKEQALAIQRGQEAKKEWKKQVDSGREEKIGSPSTGFADDLENIISKYGRPDTHDSTEYDNPRPVIVTKWISYKKQGVTFFFVPDARIGDNPPYKRWKLIGATDPILNKALNADEIRKRFGY